MPLEHPFERIINNSERLNNIERSYFDAIVIGTISVTDGQTVIQFYSHQINLTGTAIVAVSIALGFIDLIGRQVLIYRSYNDGFFVVAVLK